MTGSHCCLVSNCSVPVAFRADLADNVTGNITPSSVSVGGNVVIDQNGSWVGDPTGLRVRGSARK